MKYNVELTEEEINAIRVYLNGKIEGACIEVKKAFTSMIDKAEELQNELNAIPEVMATEDCDLVKWFINKIEFEGENNGQK